MNQIKNPVNQRVVSESIENSLTGAKQNQSSEMTLESQPNPQDLTPEKS